jgi:hypothetical protein
MDGRWNRSVERQEAVMNKWMAVIGLFVCLGAVLCGCASKPREVLTPPQPILSPYSTQRGDVLWAIALPRNESGTGDLDTLAVGDALAATVEEIKGVRAVPLNRTIAAMRSLRLTDIRTPSEALAVANVLGADAILVTSVTAYDPYTPKIGITAALYGTPNGLGAGVGGLEPREITSLTNESKGTQGRSPLGAPLSVTSNHLDGRNHDVLRDIKMYAEGRSRSSSAYGWKRYVASWPQFLSYASYRTLHDLVSREWIRTGQDRTLAVTSSDN